MCDFIDSIKFCTCGTVKKTDQSYWKLETVNPLSPASHMTGLWELTEETFADRLSEELESRILDALNSEGSFDFEYSPKEGDRMTVVISRKHRLSFEFQFERNKFRAEPWYQRAHYEEYLDAGEGLVDIKLADKGVALKE